MLALPCGIRGDIVGPSHLSANPTHGVCDGGCTRVVWICEFAAVLQTAGTILTCWHLPPYRYRYRPTSAHPSPESPAAAATTTLVCNPAAAACACAVSALVALTRVVCMAVVAQVRTGTRALPQLVEERTGRATSEEDGSHPCMLQWQASLGHWLHGQLLLLPAAAAVALRAPNG